MPEGHTSSTSPDPEMVAEGDSDQLPQEDTLLDRGVKEILDEGYSPPDRPPNPFRHETAAEDREGESLDDRLAQEQPEVWEVDGRPTSSAEPDRAGRLTASDPDPTGGAAQTVIAEDAGIAGGAASAEEAAVHIVEE
ncbi:hypothetical protein N869_05175 [Cellulomonas bogoriensis 69B4 = DSM 16987]|uniref:DUF5709 domain-containing protein n=2 Tax=Cellulomonas bogoriensis TaxID=301388 RepID=A0A0A0C3C2_9CELL|nr:hypothetical protein N869_05175 [Cellulomonas bogoriensis 69B4 = DSM 16987]